MLLSERLLVGAVQIDCERSRFLIENIAKHSVDRVEPKKKIRRVYAFLVMKKSLDQHKSSVNELIFYRSECKSIIFFKSAIHVSKNIISIKCFAYEKSNICIK